MKLFDRPFILLFLLSAIIFLYGLGKIDLIDPDEPRYARAAVEMIQTGDYLTPQFNTEIRWDKPVLFYWLVAGAYKVFGISEFSARFFSVLCTLVLLLLVYCVSASIFSKEAARLSMLSLATSVQFVVVGRLCITDMTLCFLSTAAIISFYIFLQTGKRKYLYLGFLSAALAVLTKGPVGVLLPAIIILLYAFITKKIKVFFSLHFLWGTLLFLLISVPWYLAEFIVHGWEYVNYFFVEHNIQRFATENLPHVQPFYYYLPVLIGAFFPWILFVPSGITRIIYAIKEQKEERTQQTDFGILLLLWFSVVIIFFSISSSKLPTYIMSAYIPLAFIVGVFFYGFEENKREKKLIKTFAVLTVVFAFALFIGIQIFIVVSSITPGILTWVLLYALFMVFLIVFTFLLKRRNLLQMPYSYVLVVLICIIMLPNTVFCKLNERRSLKKLAEVYHQINNDGSIPLATYVLNKPSIVFYADCYVEQLDWLGDFEIFMNENETALCVMRENEFWVLYNEFRILPVYAVSKQACFILVSNRILPYMEQGVCLKENR